MEFENNTAFTASLMRGGLPSRDTSLAVVIAKAVGVFDARGQLRLDLGETEPIRHMTEAHELGHVPADIAIRKEGLDIMALGQAYHPNPDGGPEASVSVCVGEDTRSLRVFGERSWYQSSTGEWAISEPEPFSRMDMTWGQSFGGSSFDEWDNECPHALNPEGKGFIASQDAIEDTSLPNIEDPAHLITSWEDQPAPCNIAPAPKPIAIDAAQTLQTLSAVQERSGPYRLPESIWNDAVPLFRFLVPQPGASVVLSGMSEAPLTARVPQLTLHANVQLGAQQHSLPLVLDTLLFFPEDKRCVFTYRASFQYRFVPRQKRLVRLDARFSQ
jgi:hypothetical protein